MKAAVLADVHGNLPALKAVLEDARIQGAEKFVLAGDYVFDLPWSNGVTETVRGLSGAAVAAGNKEGYLKAYQEGQWDCDQLGAMGQTMRELTPENRDYLTSLPPSATLTLPLGKRIFAAHWFPGFLTGGKQTAISSRMFRVAAETPGFTREAFWEEVRAFLEHGYVADALREADADVFVFGHTHLQWHGFAGDKLLLNPGSCGVPLDGDTRAPYTLLTETPDGFTVEERRVRYDVEAAIREAEQSEVYRRGKVWLELVFAALRTGLDTFAPFFDAASRIANERGETFPPFSDEVWNLAYEEHKACLR
ncbi:MAG: metallophosphoesterase family protein [Oscillospiraceae bacterium]|jgi:predicted phosphodiesterase|nr:metallophosphoesterase family protein [Oscillospiraceae bacterium]